MYNESEGEVQRSELRSNRRRTTRRAAHRMAAHPSGLAGIYLVFQVGGETCGLRVDQVAGLALFPPRHPLHPLPGTPRCVRGTVLSAGETVPVIDLRMKMELPAHPEPSPEHLVYACATRLDGGRQRIGALVGAVDKLMDFTPGEILAGASSATRIPAGAILGRAVKNALTVTLLALEHLVPGELATLLAHRLATSTPPTAPG